MRGLSFVTTNQDDILIHSKDEQFHRCHLQEVFKHLTHAGLTRQGRKCYIGMPKVSYLGHAFSTSSITPAPQKVEAIHDWPTPKNATALQQFLGLASYYWRYIPNFTVIAAPLNMLTQKATSFTWSHEYDKAFAALKYRLTKTPVVVYPCFSTYSDQFIEYTDARGVWLGVVLEQGGHVISYASHSLLHQSGSTAPFKKNVLL